MQAAKRIQAAHRLVLSGTPIQNSVLELWSLFDFLMPGFLGSERAFNAQYGKALAAAKASKRGSKEAEAGLLSMEGLHKQVQHVPVARDEGRGSTQGQGPRLGAGTGCDRCGTRDRVWDQCWGQGLGSE